MLARHSITLVAFASVLSDVSRRMRFLPLEDWETPRFGRLARLGPDQSRAVAVSALMSELIAHEQSHNCLTATETRKAGFEIVGAKEATYYGIGAALVRIVRAILRDKDAVLTVSSLVPESLELGEVSLSLPSVINREGVARVLSIPLNSSERRALEASANVLKQHIATLDDWIPKPRQEPEGLYYEV